jgi:hypothetical protein
MNENSLNRPLVVAVVSLSLAAGLVACEGVFNVDFDKAHLDGGASSSGSTSSGGNVPSATPEGTLAGKWDLTGSLPGAKAETGTLELGTDSIRVAMGSAVFDFSAATDRTVLTYSRYGEAHGIEVDQVAAPVSWGALPITKGGSLTFTDPVNHGGDCSLVLGAPNGSFECRDRVDGWPKVLPHPLEGSHYEMTRLEAAASSFGDLGGRWQAKSAGHPELCTIEITGNKISASCPGPVKGLGGKFDATFSTTIVSGHLSSGIEFAGNKR